MACGSFYFLHKNIDDDGRLGNPGRPQFLLDSSCLTETVRQERLSHEPAELASSAHKQGHEAYCGKKNGLPLLRQPLFYAFMRFIGL